MSEHDTIISETDAMVESMTNRCIELEDTVELAEEIIETQRVMIEKFKDAAETWQRRAIEAADEVTVAHRETDKMRERRDHWMQMFLEERAERVRIMAELSPPF